MFIPLATNHIFPLDIDNGIHTSLLLTSLTLQCCKAIDSIKIAIALANEPIVDNLSLWPLKRS